MQTNVLEYLENIIEKVPDKLAFADENSSLTFEQVSERSRKIGSCLLERKVDREPVVVYMQKSPETITAFFGVIYAGCYYVPIDEEMPARRMELILENTNAKYLIYDESTAPHLEKLHFQGEVISYEEAIKAAVQQEQLDRVRSQSLDVDPIYVLFTSGSTGMPKGVVGHHRGVIDYIDSLSEVLGFHENTVFGIWSDHLSGSEAVFYVSTEAGGIS